MRIMLAVPFRLLVDPVATPRQAHVPLGHSRVRDLRDRAFLTVGQPAAISFPSLSLARGADPVGSRLDRIINLGTAYLPGFWPCSWTGANSAPGGWGTEANSIFPSPLLKKVHQDGLAVKAGIAIDSVILWGGHMPPHG